MKKTPKETARGKKARAASLLSRATNRKETAMADETSNNADFIGRVVGDAKNPPETRMLTGWFGDSGEEGSRRLYTDAELASYVDIPDDAILYTEPIRDAQPAGAVLVWIKRDAAVKQGGSAFSRAARFLQGQVQQDFASGAGASGAAASGADVQKAGFHCVTEVPCGEVTGFTGNCTNEPQVGGAWPCITAPPHCAEPTGFTGRCTHQPWPNPTRYIGCTIYHCPTHDLTHIPHICNIVASGLPGCGGINPPDKGGDPVRNVGAEEAGGENKEAAVTSLPGCGYTKMWGLCETHLLGCGQTKDCPTTMPGCGQTNDCPTTMPGCGWSKNPICTDLPGCGFTKHWGACQQTQPPKCQVSVDVPCITQDAACGPTRPPGCGVEAAQAQQNFTPATVCTQIGCHGGGGNQTPATVCTQIGCAENVGAPPSLICKPSIACNFTQLFCRTHQFLQCHHTIICPINSLTCPTQFQPQCFPIPSPFCPVTPGCPFGPGGGGDPVRHFAGFGAAAAIPNTQAPGCFVSGVMICPTTPEGCTVPPTSPHFGCTQSGPACPTQPKTQFTQSGPHCPTSCGSECQSQQVNCTQIGEICGHKPCTPNPEVCPTLGIACTVVAPCTTKTNVQLDCTLGCTQFGPTCPQVTTDIACNTINVNQPQQAFGAQANAFPPTAGPTICTQLGPTCPATAIEACTRLCTLLGGQCHTHGQPQCPPTPATVCTQIRQQCLTQPPGDCTFFGGCHTHQQPQCTSFGPGCPPTPATICTQFAPCPTHQQPCHTPGFECTMFCTHGQPQCPPTPATVCTQIATCPTHQQPCHTPGFECTMFCTHGGPGCPPQTIQGPACPQLTAPPQCPVHSGFNCPSAIGCQSIACNQSIACQPGGGGQQQQFGAAAPAGGPQPLTQPVFFCQPSAVDACPTRLCTHIVQQCHPFVTELCPPPRTHNIIQCHPSIVDACPTRLCTHQLFQCHPSLIDACPTQHFVQCNPSAIDACPTRIGCPTHNPAQCPPASGFNCPSQFGCQSIACNQSIGCQPGGGGQQQQFGAAFTGPTWGCTLLACPPA
jgi:hypothetical protein